MVVSYNYVLLSEYDLVLEVRIWKVKRYKWADLERGHPATCFALKDVTRVNGIIDECTIVYEFKYNDSVLDYHVKHLNDRYVYEKTSSKYVPELKDTVGKRYKWVELVKWYPATWFALKDVVQGEADIYECTVVVGLSDNEVFEHQKKYAKCIYTYRRTTNGHFSGVITLEDAKIEVI